MNIPSDLNHTSSKPFPKRPFERTGENSRKFSKWLENTVGKGEIALYEQFLLFLQCFQNTADT